MLIIVLTNVLHIAEVLPLLPGAVVILPLGLTAVQPIWCTKKTLLPMAVDA